MKPRLPRDAVWHALLTWLWYEPHRKGLIRPVDEIGSMQSEVDILPALKPHIKKMLDIRHLLAADDKEARDFQEQAHMDAEQIIGAPELVAQLLSYRSGHTTKDAGTWPKVAEDIYFSRLADGEVKVPVEELHRLVVEHTGRRISMKYFSARLMESSALLLRFQPGQTRNTRLSKYVIAKNLNLSMDWMKADCREDPDLFFPPDNTDASAPQADEARRICESCPMKLPCLKLGVDVEENAKGVRGGIWLDRPEEITSEIRTMLSFITVREEQ